MDGPRPVPVGRTRAALALAAALVAGGCAAHGAARSDVVAPGAALRADAAPIEVARAFYAALHAHDAAAAGRLVASPGGARVTAAFVRIAASYQRLEEGLRAAYGDEGTRAVGYRERVAAEDEAIRRATEAVSGDDAVVTYREQTLATLRRMPAGWRIALDDALTSEAGIAALAREADATRAAVERVEPAIRHRLFPSADDALEAFRNEMSARLQGDAGEEADEDEAPPPTTL